MAKQDDYTRYTIRLPTPLYERVREAAGEKSVNAEIAERLMASFDRFGPFSAEGADAVARSLEANIDASYDLVALLVYELRAAGGILTDDDREIAEAVKRFAADNGLSRGVAAQHLLRDALRAKGYLPG